MDHGRVFVVCILNICGYTVLVPVKNSCMKRKAFSRRYRTSFVVGRSWRMIIRGIKIVCWPYAPWWMLIIRRTSKKVRPSNSPKIILYFRMVNNHASVLDRHFLTLRKNFRRLICWLSHSWPLTGRHGQGQQNIMSFPPTCSEPMSCWSIHDPTPWFLAFKESQSRISQNKQTGSHVFFDLYCDYINHISFIQLFAPTACPFVKVMLEKLRFDFRVLVEELGSKLPHLITFFVHYTVKSISTTEPMDF